jgi:hypothetical protein
MDMNSAPAVSASITPITPAPLWEETPGKITDGNMAGVWAGRYQKLVMNRHGEPDVDVDVDFAIPPTESAKPVLIDGVWHWTDTTSDIQRGQSEGDVAPVA